MNYTTLNKNVREDLQKLGIENVSIPEGADMSDLMTNEPKPDESQVTSGVQSQQLEPKPDDIQPTNVGGNQQLESEPSGVNQENTQGQQEISQDEVSRRQVQSERDKLRIEVEESNRKNEYLMQMMAGISGSRNASNDNGVNNSVTPSPVNLKEPLLSDYINESDYDPEDAGDPRSRSGIAERKLQGALRSYDRDTMKREIKQEVADEHKTLTQRDAAMKQAVALATRYPSQFANPFTGEPDLNKVQSFIQKISTSNEENLWVDLYEFEQNKSGKPKPTDTPNILEKINSKANQVAPVAGKHGVERQTTALPKEIQDIAGVYGGLDIPDNAEFG